MKSLVAIMSVTSTALLFSIPAKAEVAEIRNPLWQEVPGTSMSSEGSAYVNTNGIMRNGDTVTYDMINPGASYNRVEANCRTNQFRATRKGFFESETRVSYLNQVDSWNTAIEPYHQALMRFVCNLPGDPNSSLTVAPQPYPQEHLGRLDYYRFRYDDFVRRNPDTQPPDYYLEFGEKYLTRFMNETYPNLTQQGQVFLQTVGRSLQQRIEDRLNANPQSFAELEQDSDRFREFAYGTHPDSYCESGWGNLPESDRDQIIEAVDRSDLYFSIEGIITGLQLANRCGSFLDVFPDVFP